MADDLARPRGTVRIRLGPGILRNYDIARSIAGFPFPAERTGEVEAALGEDGWFGPHGIERFLAALRRLGLRQGLARTPHVDVHVTAGYLAFSMPGAVLCRGWPPAPEVGAHLAAAGFEFTADGSSGPKDAAATGSLVAALERLTGRRVFFIGAPRTRPFAAALGVAEEAHFIIPDRAAYALTDDIVGAARRFIAVRSTQPPVIVHAASLVGNTVMLELAATETAFVGLDLGLAATIYDDEYLSTRGWFIDHGVGIIRTRDALAARTGAVPFETAETRHARAVAFGLAWRAATKQWRGNQQAALETLEVALADTVGLHVPIARATSLLWRHRLNLPLPADWEARLLAEPVKHEPATIASLMLWSSGRVAEALEALDRAARLCPADELVGRLRRHLSAPDARGADTSLIDGLVTLPERPYLGSALSWSLSGDLPRRWPDARPDRRSMDSTPAPAPNAVAKGTVIPVMRPRLPRADRIVEYLREIDDSRVYANFGPLEVRLRNRLAALVDCDPECVVTFANATIAITGLVALSGINAWDVPCFTFPAVGHAVLMAGKRLQIRDIAPDSMRLAVAPVPTGAARIDVMPFGAGVPRSALDVDCPALIVDAAASLGAANAPLRLVRPGDAVVFSLHATKVLGCGEGGFAVCGCPDHARRLRTWTNFGFCGDRDSRSTGTNGKLGEFGAAVAHAALDEWPKVSAAWCQAQTLARAAGAACGLRSLPPNPPEVSPYWIVMFDTPALADAAETALAAREIGTRRWWSRGLHRMPAFAPLATGGFPVTDWIAGCTLGLPMFPGMTADQVARIGEGLACCTTSTLSDVSR